MTRICTKCDEVKPLTDFALAKTGKHGRRSQCKSCVNRLQSRSGWRGPTGRVPMGVLK